MVLKTMRVSIDQFSGSLSDIPFTFPNTTGICQIQGRYFMQVLDPNGTYSLTSVEKFNDGLLLEVQTIDLDAARAQGMTLQYVPNIDQAVQDQVAMNQPSFLSGSIPFILDNTHLTPEQVISVMKPISYQIVLKSVPANSPRRTFKSKARMSLSRKGIQIRRI